MSLCTLWRPYVTRISMCMPYSERTALQTSHFVARQVLQSQVGIQSAAQHAVCICTVRNWHAYLSRASATLYYRLDSMQGSRKVRSTCVIYHLGHATLWHCTPKLLQRLQLLSQSPFIGKTVPLDSVLYPRYYDDPSKVTLVRRIFSSPTHRRRIFLLSTPIEV